MQRSNWGRKKSLPGEEADGELFDGDDLVLIAHQFRDENTMEKLPLNKILIDV